MSDVAALLDGLSSATVLAAMSPQLPSGLVRDVLTAARVREVKVTLLVADLTGAWDFLDADAEADLVAERLRVVTLAGAVPRRLAPYVGQLPVSLWEVDRLIGSGRLPIDVFLARVGDQGTYGDMVGFSPTALAAARRVGFEVTAQDVVHRGTRLSLDRADLLVPAGPVDQRPGRKPTATQERIAATAADLVPDGATLQIGVGTLPDAILAALTDHRDLRIHSGVVSAGVQQLIHSGTVVSPVTATGVLGGDPAGWGHRLRLEPITHTHDPQTLLQLPSLWALNSAFEVDLAGQVNAEYADGLRLTSGGGQVDFARAAHAGEGLSVIALPSRTADGTSRIVPRLGCPVTTPAGDVDAVVTEHGVALLTGRTTAERVNALVSIAHPDDRAALRAAAHPTLRSTG